MKSRIRRLLLLPGLIIGLGLMPASQVTAQILTNLHNFTALVSNTNSDGANPQTGVILASNTLYGTTDDGGASGVGAVFAVNTNGTDFTNLYNFAWDGNGANPKAGLVISGNTLYGTTYYSGGGSPYNGTLFAIHTDGTGYTNLHSFTAYTGSSSTNGDGANPEAGLIISGNTLYGTAFDGGASGWGTVFAISTDGSSFTNLHSFTGSDGGLPVASLVLSGHTLYGAAQVGDTGKGTVFALNTDGTGFTNLYNFSSSSGPYPATNSDGASPNGLMLAGNTLYGTAPLGGIHGWGTVFRLNLDGTDFTNMHSFTSPSPIFNVNSDGAVPAASLILSGRTLYGVTQEGGSSDSGTVFAIDTNGSNFRVLYNLDGNPQVGSYQVGGFSMAGTILYGTTSLGGSLSQGTVFNLSLSPQLSIIPSGTNVVLTWLTNYTGFTLQSTRNLTPTAIWNTNLPSPIIVNGQNTVTNPITGTQQFYRLSQ